jgi:beta-galactosidase
MIFIANYWTDPSETTITVYSNCDNVELRLNNVLIVNGGKENNENSTHLLRPPFIFKIDRYIPGNLEAIGFIKGKSVVRTNRRTPQKIRHHLGIELDISGKPLTKNDIVFIYVYIYDKNNVVIPDADDWIQFSLLDGYDQASLIGENPVCAEAGIATILLKTSSVVSYNKLTIIASSLTVQQQETRFAVSITR